MKAVGCAGVAAAFLALYAATAQRGVSWQDSGEFQYRVLAADYRWLSGLARAHPLYIGLARLFRALFPAGQALYAVTLFSGLGLSVALALLGATVWRLTASVRCVAVSVVTLGLAHMAWWLATVAEVYTWSLALLLAEVYCLVRVSEKGRLTWLAALFFVNGAHAAVHNFAFLSLPVHLVVAVRVLEGQAGRRAAWAAGLVVAWAAGASPLVGLAAAEWRAGASAWATLKSVLVGDGYGPLVLGCRPAHGHLVAANMALAGLSLLNPCWLFAAWGWRGVSGRGAWKPCLLALTVLHGVFWVRYFVPDQATFVLPTLGLLAVWAGVGCGAAPFSKRAVLAAVLAGACGAVAVPAVTAEAARRAGVRRDRALPGRDEARYWLVPWKQRENSAERFVAAVEAQLQAGDVLVADATAAGPLLAARAAGRSGNAWRLVTPWSAGSDERLKAWQKGADVRLFVVSPQPGYAPPEVLQGARDFVSEGVLFRALGGAKSAGGRP